MKNTTQLHTSCHTHANNLGKIFNLTGLSVSGYTDKRLTAVFKHCPSTYRLVTSLRVSVYLHN